MKDLFHSQFTIPVLRETRATHLESTAKALARGGMKIIEITLMSESAFDVIAKLAKDPDLIIGAGTVLTADQAKKAIDSGVKFLVSPGLNEAAVKVAAQNSVPFVPGVLTPTEIMRAQELGCDMVKIFPITSVGGPSYIRSLQGPFPKLSFMATGGISLPDISTYLKSGCTCVGLGNHLTPTELINGQDWKGLTQLAQQYTAAVASARR